MDEERYARQIRLKQIGAQGQKRLSESRVAIVGCGALGTHQSEMLARAGVGFLRIVDRDVVEVSNLPRQALFDENDARNRLPKAQAAAEKLRRINSELRLEVYVSDFNSANAEQLLAGVDVVLDASDNFETRYLINDVCVKRGLPWCYGGVLGTAGMALFVEPGRGPCLRCLFPQMPEPGTLPTCEDEGVLVTAPATVAARQVNDVLHFLIQGKAEARLYHFELWSGDYRSLEVFPADNCPCCRQGIFEFLDRPPRLRPVSLCGRNAVQLLPEKPLKLDLAELEKRLSGSGRVSNNGFLVTLEAEGCELWFFPDGRVMVKGTDDPARARSLCARYLGC